jgi:TonB family protein
MLFLAIASPSLCLAQASQELDVSKLLAETGYKYTEYETGRWRIPELAYDGENLKIFDIYLDPVAQKRSLKISLRLGFIRRMAGTPEFKEKQADLNKRFEPTEFVLNNVSLFAVRELPANNLDKETLVKALEKMAKDADQTHPELAKFIEMEAKPSVGYGQGGGMGVGPGYRANEPGSSEYNRPEDSRSNVARTVDSRPVMLNRVRPEYTDLARQNKVTGIVVLRVLVDETGEVKQVRVVRGLPDGLNEKAIEAARKTKFRPAMKDGKAVAHYIVLNVEFNLR